METGCDSLNEPRNGEVGTPSPRDVRATPAMPAAECEDTPPSPPSPDVLREDEIPTNWKPSIPPSSDEEEEMFQKWITASLEHGAAEESFMQRVLSWCRKGWEYDPPRRRFLPFQYGADRCPACSYFQYRPSSEDALLPTVPSPGGSDAALSDRAVADAASSSAWSAASDACPFPAAERLARRYDLKVVCPRSYKHAITPQYLSRFLLRSYAGRTPTRVTLVRVVPNSGCSPAFGLGDAPSSERRLQVITLDEEQEEPLGQRLNEAAMRCIDGSYKCDLIVLQLPADADRRHEKETVIDMFYPVYPVFLENEGVFVLSPLHLLQVNGVDPSLRSGRAVQEGLLIRIAKSLGAVLLERGAHSSEWIPVDGPIEYPHHEEGSEQGFNVLLESRVEQAGSVHRVRPGLARHVAPLAHGWLSSDSRTLLAAAMRLFRPKVVLELGTWYGLSSRLIADLLVAQQREEAQQPRRFFAVDRFKNNAIFDHPFEPIHPIDKMFLNHPRFETAHRHLEPAAELLQSVNSDSGVFLVQMDGHNAPAFLKDAGESPGMVFIDFEKETVRLGNLLRDVMSLFPHAVIVGDDYSFETVRAAVAQLGLPSGRVLCLDEAYMIVPDSYNCTSYLSPSDVRLVVDKERAKIEQSRPEGRKSQDFLDLIHVRHFETALQWARECGMDLLHSPLLDCRGGYVLHEMCRTKDEDALGRNWEALFGNAGEWTPPLCNAAACTPFDYLRFHFSFE